MESGKPEVVGPSNGRGSVSAMVEEEKKQELVMKEGDGAFADEEEDEEENENGHQGNKQAFENFVPGPLLPLKDQIEKDKEDESLRRWKEKLLGCLESDLNADCVGYRLHLYFSVQMEPEVQFHSIGIISSDFGEINTPFPIKEDKKKNLLFTLKEGSEYQLKLTFSVLHNIVSGLAYTNTVWKGGIQVDQSKGMLGTFAPSKEPYVHILEEETTPSGVLARGVYAAKLKFEDDDKRRYVELDYSFEIRKR